MAEDKSGRREMSPSGVAMKTCHGLFSCYMIISG